MATLTGELGSVKWLTTLADSAGGQQVQGTAVAEVRSWTVDYTKDAIEDTAMGDGARTYISGLTSWSGTMECLFNTSQAGLAIFDPSVDSTLLVQFITDTTTAGTSYQGGGSGGGASVPKTIGVGDASNKVDLGKGSSNASGEIAYLRGEKGRGTSAADFRPGGFAGKRYRAYGGSAYVVGEQGPELFMPEVPGQVVTNDDAASMGAPLNVSFNVSAMDSTNMQDMLTSQRGNIITMIREAANSHGSGFLEEVDTSTYDEGAGGSI